MNAAGRIIVKEGRIMLSYLPRADVPRVYTSDGRIIQLDALSHRIWELCDGTRSRDEVVEEVAREYGIPARLVRRALERMMRLGLVHEVEAP